MAFIRPCRQPAQAQSAGIVLLYTDLTDGPKTGGENNNGVYVTLFGVGFGATRGAGSVTLGGGAVATYVSWSDSKIVVQLGAAVASGNFTVTNNAAQSVTGCRSKPYGQTNDFVVRAGAIYFVAASGSSGSGTVASPFIQSQVYANIAAGATFYLRAGTYTQQLGYTGWSDTSLTIGLAKTGSAQNCVAFSGYPGETAQLSGHDVAISCRDGGSAADKAAYVTAANLRLIGDSMAFDNGGFVGAEKSGGVAMRLVNCDCTAAYAAGINTMTGIATMAADGGRCLGSIFRDTGGLPGQAGPWNNNHAIYIQFGACDTEVGWCTFYNLRLGYVIQNHTDVRYTYTGILIHDNDISLGPNGDCRGITLSDRNSDSTAEIYNNVLGPGIGQGGTPLHIGSGSANVYNNTIYQGSGGCISVENFFNTIISVVCKNNVLVSNSGEPYYDVGNTVTVGGSLLTVDYNLYYGNGNGPSADTHAINGNPLFTNAATRDFTLQAGSPAINAGTSTMYATIDHRGASRSGSVDIGAYEA